MEFLSLIVFHGHTENALKRSKAQKCGQVSI